jgi:phage terminase small subunit
MAGKKLTPQQRALVKNLTKGMSITDAAREAGYADNGYVGQMGSQALENIRLKMPAILDKHGLTDEVLVEDYLKPLLNAEETEFAKFEGRITDERNVIAWGPRKEGLDIAFRLKGSYAPKSADEIDAGNITINLGALPRRNHA